jgi:hypothetical protein
LLLVRYRVLLLRLRALLCLWRRTRGLLLVRYRVLLLRLPGGRFCRLRVLLRLRFVGLALLILLCVDEERGREKQQRGCRGGFCDIHKLILCGLSGAR